MSEVHGDVLADHVEFLEQRGIGVERWLGSAPLPERSVERLRDRSQRVAWHDFVPLCDSYWELLESLGLNEAFADFLIAKPDGSTSGFRRVFSMAVTLPLLYSILLRVTAISSFRCSTGRVVKLDKHRLKVVLDIQPGFAHCDAFFRYSGFVLERLPRFVGLNVAHVESVVTQSRCEYLVTLPPHRIRLVDWIRSIGHYILGARVVFREIGRRESELKDSYVALLRSQAQLTKVHQELEARVAERTSEYLAAKDEAEASSRAKSAFLSNVSHELRTPLTSILGFTEILVARGEDPEVRRQAIEVIDRNGHQLLSLVDDLLDIGRIESDALQVKLAPVDVRSEIASVLASLATQAAKRGAVLSSSVADSVPERLRSDPVRFRQILTNVVGNAVKFSDGGRVEVRAGVASSLLTVEVEDFGGGIAEEKHERIFEPFEQDVPPTREGRGGVGLGLTIARRLARALGGDLKLARSKPGKGSLFVVTIALH